MSWTGVPGKIPRISKGHWSYWSWDSMSNRHFPSKSSAQDCDESWTYRCLPLQRTYEMSWSSEPDHHVILESPHITKACWQILRSGWKATSKHSVSVRKTTCFRREYLPQSPSELRNFEYWKRRVEVKAVIVTYGSFRWNSSQDSGKVLKLSRIIY